MLDDYLHSLSPNAAKYITPTKIMKVLSLDYETSVKALLKLEDGGILNRYFGIRCPECSMLIKTAETLEELKYVSINTCYSCEEEIEISKDDVVILFRINEYEFPFESGQQKTSFGAKKESTFVAQEKDSYYDFSNMEEYLKVMAQNAEHEHTSRLIEQEKNEDDKKLERKAVKIYKRNTKISIALSFIGYFILVYIIIYVYKQYGYSKIATFSTFGSSLIPFGINYIILKMFPQDIGLIKRILKAENST
ncbi:MAG: hypothetical protein F8N38_01165 [Hungatella sp.]|nr:hypothetical protein [Hungatella sp.]